MKTRHHGSRDRPEVAQRDTGVPARHGRPSPRRAPTLQLRTRPARAEATELRAVFQSLETRCSAFPVPGWQGTRTGREQPHGERSPAPGQEPRPLSPCWDPSGAWHRRVAAPRDAPHPSCSSPGSSSSGPLRKALPALGAVCFSRDLPLQLEFIWGFMPGPPPRVTVNNSPPRQPPMLTHDSGGRQPGEQLLLFPSPKEGQMHGPTTAPGGSVPFPNPARVLPVPRGPS